MTDLIEELRAGAELEEAYDADGIIRTGYQRSLRWMAAAEIERLQFSADAAHQVADDLEHEIKRLRNAIKRHRIDMWGEDKKIGHPLDVELYRILD